MPKPSKPKKSFPTKRKFALRRDVTVASGTREIARVFDLPTVSVRLELPRGRRARSEKRIGALLDDWKRAAR